MGLHTAIGLSRWVKSAEAKTLHASRLNIGPRLILGFVSIILSMLAADAVILWQFHLVRTQAERLNGIDQKLVAVLRVHTSLLAFHVRLEELADSQDVGRLVTEGGPLRTAVLEDTRRALSVLRLAMTRSITQPLARLVEGSKALARGEFQHQVSVTGKDELAHLGQVFNDTARRLRDLYATLQSSEDRLRLVINTIPAHVWSTRPDGSVDFVNRRWLESTGLAMEDALGWDWGSVIHPDDLARYVDGWHAALAAGKPMEIEARVRQAKGDYRSLLIRNVPLRDELGNIVKWYGTGLEIEDRKRAEEALRQAQADLEQVNRVTTMGELTASLAHEVNQPIAAAVTNANACLRWLAGNTPNLKEARAAAMRIVKDGTRAGEIISRIRLLFKKGTPERELVDLNEVIQEMIVLLRSEAMRYSISVRTELEADLPQAMG